MFVLLLEGVFLACSHENWCGKNKNQFFLAFILFVSQEKKSKTGMEKALTIPLSLFNNKVLSTE